MDETRKQRDQLLDQMETLRRQLASLEVELFDGTLDLGHVINPSQRIEERIANETHAEILPAFESLTVESVNISSGGACFQSLAPLRFRVRMPEGNSHVIREAELVWLDGESPGMNRIGFKFID